MSHLLHRDLRKTPPIAAAGEGVYLFDQSGNRYLDASGGAAVSCLGHGHPEILAAIREQVDRLAYAHTAFFTSEPAEQLADQLIRTGPPGMSHAYLVSGGSEAMEAALKLARQYFVERGQPGRTVFIAREQSYHGNTLGALAVGGNRWRRAQFAPLLIPVERVSPCYEYRGRVANETPEAYGERLADELEATIQRVGPEKVIAFVAETVVGATAGVLLPVPGYFRRIREICDRYDVLLILDEVMCGTGRTGTLHACEQENVRPDLLAQAKGLGAGYQPIGGMLVSARIVDTLVGGSGFFQHGHTYMGHPTACAAALAVQRVFERDRLIQRVAEKGKLFGQRLRDVFDEHPYVGDVRGRGYFWGIELVADRASKEPFDPKRATHRRVKTEAFRRGLLVYPMGGTIDGVRGDHILLAPPFIATDAELDLMVERLKEAVDAATIDAAD
jgi:adenosylmethionine-8-amino-7-oxononanoate aminotransferase